MPLLTVARMSPVPAPPVAVGTVLEAARKFDQEPPHPAGVQPWLCRASRQQGPPYGQEVARTALWNATCGIWRPPMR